MHIHLLGTGWVKVSILIKSAHRRTIHVSFCNHNSILSIYIQKYLFVLQQSLCRLAHTMMEIVKTVEEHLLMEDVEKLDLGEVYCNTMNNCYKLAFDVR